MEPSDNEIIKIDQNLIANLNEYKYFSSKFLRKYLKQKVDAGQKVECDSQKVFACILFADISGFTQLSSRLSAEELKKHINEYFSLLLGVIHANYGDVVKFCGDAVMIIWPIPVTSTSEMKASTVLMASLCGLQLLEECGEYKKFDSKSGTSVELSLHCGISCGEISFMILTNGHRSEFIITGGALKEMGDAEGLAKTGEICIYGTAFEYVKNKLEGVLKTSNNGNNSNIYKLTGKLNEGYLMSLTQLTPSSPERMTSDSEINRSIDIEDNSFLTPKSSPLKQIRDTGDDLWSFFTKTSISSPKSDNDSYDDTAENSEIRFRNRRSSLAALFASNSSTASSGKGKQKTSSFFQRRNSNETSSHIESKNSEKSTGRRILGKIVNGILDDTTAVSSSRSGDIKESIDGESKIKKSYGTRYLKYKLKVNTDPIITEMTEFIVNGNVLESCKKSAPPTTTNKSLALSLELRKFIHETALGAINSHTSALLSEMRVVTTIFIEIIGLESDFYSGNITRPQKAFCIILSTLQRFGGSLRQFVVDDKGCVCIVCFGLFGSHRENNSAQAIEFSQLLRFSLQTVGINSLFGITTGKVYCGIVGAGHRCEFAVMGSSVNLAARLMCACKRVSAGILVESTVHRNSQCCFDFQMMDKIEAKGYSEPVAVFTPLTKLRPVASKVSKCNSSVSAVEPHTSKDTCQHTETSGTIVKYDRHLDCSDELNAIASTIIASLNPEKRLIKSSSTIVYGPSGVGLTTFLKFLDCELTKSGIHKLVSVRALACNQYMSYNIIANILLIIMGVHESHIPDEMVNITEGNITTIAANRNSLRTKAESFINSSGNWKARRSSGSSKVHRRLSAKTLDNCQSTTLAAIVEQPFESTEVRRNSNAITNQLINNIGSNALQRSKTLTTSETLIMKWCEENIDSELTLGQAFHYCLHKSIIDYYKDIKGIDSLNEETTTNLTEVLFINCLPIINDVLRADFPIADNSLQTLFALTTSDVVLDLFTDVVIQVLVTIALGGTIQSSFEGKPSNVLILLDDIQFCDVESFNIYTRIAVKLKVEVRNDERGVGQLLCSCNDQENRQSILNCTTDMKSKHSYKLNLAASIRRGISQRSLQMNIHLASLCESSQVYNLPRLPQNAVQRITKDIVGYKQWNWLLKNYKIAVGLPELMQEGKANTIYNGAVTRRRSLVVETGHGNSAKVLGRRKSSSSKIVNRASGRRSSSFALIEQMLETPGAEHTLHGINILAGLTLNVDSNNKSYREELICRALYSLSQDGLPLLVHQIADSLGESLQSNNFNGLQQLPVIKKRLQLALEIVDSLDGGEVAVLKTASIIGNTFNTSELTAVLASIGLTNCCQHDSLDSTLTRLVDVRLIYVSKSNDHVDIDVNKSFRKRNKHAYHRTRYYSFLDESTRLALYNIMLESQRCTAHTAYAFYLEKQGCTAENLKQITDHFMLGDNSKKKIEYLMLSSDHAEKQNEYNLSCGYLADLVSICCGKHLHDILDKGKEVIESYISSNKSTQIVRSAIKPTAKSKRTSIFQNKVSTDTSILETKQYTKPISSSEKQSTFVNAFYNVAMLHQRQEINLNCPILMNESIEALGISHNDIIEWIAKIATMHYSIGDMTSFETYLCLSMYLSETLSNLKSTENKQSNVESDNFMRICSTTLNYHDISETNSRAATLLNTKMLNRFSTWITTVSLLRRHSNLHSVPIISNKTVPQRIFKHYNQDKELLALTQFIRGKLALSLKLFQLLLEEYSEKLVSNEAQAAFQKYSRYQTSTNSSAHLAHIATLNDLFRVKCGLMLVHQHLNNKDEYLLLHKECYELSRELISNPESTAIYNIVKALHLSAKGKIELSIDVLHKAKNYYFSKASNSMKGIYLEMWIAWLLTLLGRVDESRFLIITVHQHLKHIENSNADIRGQLTTLRKSLINLDSLCILFSSRCWYAKTSEMLFDCKYGARYDVKFDDTEALKGKNEMFSMENAGRVGRILGIFEAVQNFGHYSDIKIFRSLKSLIDFYSTKSHNALAEMLLFDKYAKVDAKEYLMECCAVTTIFEGVLMFMTLYSTISVLQYHFDTSFICIPLSGAKELLALTCLAVSQFRMLSSTTFPGLMPLFLVLRIELELAYLKCSESEVKNILQTCLLAKDLALVTTDQEIDDQKSGLFDFCFPRHIAEPKPTNSESQQELLRKFVEMSEEDANENFNTEEDSLSDNQWEQYTKSSKSSVSTNSTNSTLQSKGGAFSKFPFANFMLKASLKKLDEVIVKKKSKVVL